MRRIVVVVLGLSFGFAALSDSATARPRNLPRALLGIITKPLEVLRPPRGIGRRGTHRRPAAARTRQTNPVATRSAPPSVPAPAAANAAAPAAAAGVTAAATTAVAAPVAAATASDTPSTDNVAPDAAPSQRTAAAPQANDAPQPRGRDASRPGRSAPRPAPAQTTPEHFGVVGPPTWPNAYEDILGFTLWPDKYGERLRAHGIGDVMSALFAPVERTAGRGGQATARTRADDATRSDAVGASSTCTSSPPASSNWPAKPIEQAMELSDLQRAALEQLRTAVNDGVAAIRAAACRDEAGSNSAERLHAMQHTLWAVRDAAMLVRAPLINFYRSLTEEQKKHFIVPATQADPRLAQMEQRARQGRGANQRMPREVARMCGMSAANEWPLRQIEHAIQPNKAQKASLEALQKKATEMGQLLIASCLQAIAATPEARLDQALDRLTAMLFAVTNITLAFNDFHGQLGDDQKSKLSAFGL
jgi:hypothetical protein